MIRRTTTVLATGLLLIAGCGSKSGNNGETTPAEEFTDVDAPEFIVVQDTEAGVDALSTNAEPILGDEAAVAEAEAQAFSEGRILEVAEDDAEVDGSQDAFYGWGYYGYKCYSARYYGRPIGYGFTSDYGGNGRYNFANCRPTWRRGMVKVRYRYVGRSYNSRKRCYYNRYRRQALYRFDNDGHYKRYDYRGYNNGYRKPGKTNVAIKGGENNNYYIYTGGNNNVTYDRPLPR